MPAYARTRGATYREVQLAPSHAVVKKCALDSNLKTKLTVKTKLSNYTREIRLLGTCISKFVS